MVENENTYPGDLSQCRPLEASEPPAHTFEFGLALAGAVSAGAYTGGVIDFLIEALDSWYAAKDRALAEYGDDTKKWDVPSHDVRLKVIAGASAGAITGAIAAAALRYAFPRADAQSEQASGNPFYDAWVNGIDIADFLADTDLKENPRVLHSLLDSTKLAKIADLAVSYAAPIADRRYLANPLRLIITLGNLRGIPYSIKFRGNTRAEHEMTCHGDHLRYCVLGLGERQGALCPDEVPLTFPNSSLYQPWSDLGKAALASGAFPLFLAPRDLLRPLTDYGQRFVPFPGNESPLYGPLPPNWSANEPDPYRFLAVDGGTMDNEPLELARIELAGLIGRNPRSGCDAKRAVVMVDPFPDPSALGPEEQTGLLKTATALLSSWKGQARFKATDVALAQHATVYSRFMITPDRGEHSGASKGHALASGALDGFSGFLDVEYRRHDYFLGRRNCQQFLREHFTLPAENKIFDGWSSSLKARYVDKDGDLPIIPLVGNMVAELHQPAWPVDRYPQSRLNELQERIEHRLKVVQKGLLKGQEVSRRLRVSLSMALWLSGARKKAAQKAREAVEEALKERGL
jgi:hypothetical protein